jgi:DNA-binding MarR family transcriptional regulator
MNLRQLEHLLAVAETGSFSRAAERQHLTQPALSRSIQSLEDDLGARLIDRSGKRNELTPLGQAVAARARHIVLRSGRAAPQRRAAQARRSRAPSELALGSGPGVDADDTVSDAHGPAPSWRARRRDPWRDGTAADCNCVSETLDALVIDVRRIAPAPDLAIENLSEMRTDLRLPQWPSLAAAWQAGVV